MIDSVVLLILGAIVGAFVFFPMLRKDAELTHRVSHAVSAVAELQSRHDMLLANLKDLEDDRNTGKLDDEDYAALKTSLTAQAVGVLKELDAASKNEEESARAVPRPVAVESAPRPDRDR